MEQITFSCSLEERCPWGRGEGECSPPAILSSRAFIVCGKGPSPSASGGATHLSSYSQLWLGLVEAHTVLIFPRNLSKSNILNF